MSCFTGCSPRRQFLRGALLGAGALSLTACGGGRDSEDAGDDQDWTDIAPAESLPVGEAGIAEVGEHTLLVNRPDEDSVMVFSAVCPHEGCTVGMDEDRFECPCHGSQFEFTGERIAGPAPRGLTSYDAEISEGTIRARLT